MHRVYKGYIKGKALLL